MYLVFLDDDNMPVVCHDIKDLEKAIASCVKVNHIICYDNESGDSNG